jgi:hypothetical protein
MPISDYGNEATAARQFDLKRQKRSFRKLFRNAALAGLVPVALIVGTYASLRIAMAHMGPPPLQAAASLVPTAAVHDAKT